MTREAPSTSGQQSYNEAGYVLPSGRTTSERKENEICVQTGEEFSTEFLRDRAALRRLPLISEVEQYQPKRLGFNLNKNHQLAYEDLSATVGLHRIDSECSSEFFEFVLRTEYGAEAENKTYTDNINRYHWEYGAIGQVPGNFSDESKLDQVTPAIIAPPLRVVGSNHSYYPHGPEISEASFPGKMKILCSFGGRILPRPSDGKLRYVGGETRIISIRKNVTWVDLMKKTSAICNQLHTIKYQLPGEDLDALISVCSDEDLHHMIEEYQELERIEGSHRLRIFLVSSNEPESPSSLEGKATQTSDADYQYIVAVNGTVDPSSRKSSSGQSLTSQNSQFGNNSDYSPTLHRDSPTSPYNLEIRDCSPSSSNLAGVFSKPASQYLTALQIPSKSFNQSPPISPSQRRDPNNSNLQIYVDRPCADGNQIINLFVKEKLPCENPYCIENLYYPDALAYYNNLSHGPTLMNYQQPNEYLVETGHNNKSHDRHFHDRSPRKDSEYSPSYGQSEMNYEKRTLGESEFYSEKVPPFPDAPMGLWPGFNNTDVSHGKILQVLSDSQLQEHGERSNCYFSLSPLSAVREKSLSLEIPNSSLQCEERIDDKPQIADYENQPTSETAEDCKKISKMDQDQKDSEGNVEVTSCDNATEFKKFPDLNYLPSVCLSLKELQNLRGRIHVSPVISLKCSPERRREPSLDFQADATVPEFSIKSQTSKKDKHCATTETLSIQAASDGYPGILHVASRGLDDQESMDQRCKSTTSTVFCREAPLYNSDPLDYSDHKVDIVGHGRPSYDEAKFGDVIGVQSQPSYCHPDNKKLESVIIVEDITDSTRPGAPLSSKVVSSTENEANDDLLSPRQTEAENATLNSECKGVKGNRRDIDDSITDATIAEMEAGIYGLQIISNADLEELKELGSGTFGTVYHGKWRGTDVAIKRIKKSCFQGNSSEQERLIKDFWREARILSTLHHPNVVAFYGVVPDGPEGTLATVTEFMASGSLRNVLLRKDRVLDRQKRLIIAMDAAFGMEYLHLKNIVHFDLKCDNLLVNLRDPERPICKVGDFGLSRIKRNTLVSGGVRGTLPWMAPELLNGSSSRVSEKVDVFSFGIVMWEILTGEEPYANMHCGAIIGGIVNNTLRPPIPKRRDPEWKKLMEECWSPDPTARPSFTEITNRLRDMSTALLKKRRGPANR
ncbi:uncharacterized protein LOC122316439 [Carya illinoinensis]|uniref:Protein kinase domain-containing protein n=1 Tax=Carya illinoinensis TaxID=32201 RepID=A0A8T1RKD4_CARIL|nr:uncharacterized protein LOC122316439 [Carya illinoinensis]XP_042988899.1 uncharacterized protein LOC122316439 [Carya illinoinensis]KAG6667790.1 hypothetical protein CIPAW_01G125800 [Carya illinoinensis]